MPRNDKLYEESRIIRKAVNEGKTTSEIMQMLSLTSAQIKYRVETRYTGKVASSIIKALEKNDKGEPAKKSSKKEEATSSTIVVDTCALKCNGAFEFIMSFENVILLIDIVKQLDNHKADEGIFGKNIRALLKVSAEDRKEKKIKIRTAGEVNDSTDSKLLAFCKGKDVLLYTADNALATFARWYGINYILAKDLEQTESSSPKAELIKTPLSDVENETQRSKIKVTSSKESAKEEKCEDKQLDLKQIDLEVLKRQMQENSMTAKQTNIAKSTIKNVSFLGKFLTLTIPETSRIKYLVIAKNEVKQPVNNIINLKIGDDIVIATYKLQEESLTISRFEITDLTPEEHAIYLGTDKVKEANQIEKLDLPREAKSRLKSYYSLVKR